MRTHSSGQIVIEYVLLLVIAVALATLIVGQMVGRGDDANDSGFMLRVWQSINRTIGDDYPDHPAEN